jgi:hypothetical protein
MRCKAAHSPSIEFAYVSESHICESSGETGRSSSEAGGEKGRPPRSVERVHPDAEGGYAKPVFPESHIANPALKLSELAVSLRWVKFPEKEAAA